MVLSTVCSFARAVGLTAALLLTVPATAQTDELQDVNQMLKQGQFDQALSRINSYLASRPKDARGRFLKGLILAEQNKPNDAIRVFADLTQDFPDLPGPYNNLAVLYASQGQYDKARDFLEQAIRTHPSYATAHENLGGIYAKMASQAYDKALQLEKGNASSQARLSLVRDLFPSDPRAAKVAASKIEPPAKIAAAPAGDSAIKAAVAPIVKPPAAVAAAPDAATKPAPKPAPAKSLGKEQDADKVLAFVTAWAKAWSENDIPAYLGAYAPDFRTPKGESRAAWEAERKARIAKPRKIQVAIEAPKVKFEENNRATVIFRQNYRSDTLKSSNTKTLVMTKAGDKWLIHQERSGR
jgi:tetratricopeptide (TPR) repeat protein